MPITCTSHCYFGSLTFDLGAGTFTKHHITCQNRIFAAFCKYLRSVRRTMTLVDLWPTFQGHIGHHDLGLCLLVQYCLNKTSYQCQNGTFGEFYQYLICSDLWPTFQGQICQCDLSVCPSNFSQPIYMTDIKPSLHIYHAQYLYLALLFWISDLWPWHGDLYLDFACYHKIARTKHSINAKTVHLLHFANIWDEFEGQWPWLTIDPLFKVTYVNVTLDFAC